MSEQPATAAGNKLTTELLALASALTFLTRLPLPAFPYRPELLGKSVTYFPLVGAIVALLGAATYYLALLLWTPAIACTLALIAMILSTGAFHEDGLADTADGIGGAWLPEDRLRIMKDSRIGTYGAIALLAALLLKLAALASMAPALVLPALLAGHMLGRWSTLPLVRYLDYASGSEGSGKPFVGAVTVPRLLLASLFTAGLLLLLLPGQAAQLCTMAVILSAASGWYFHRKIGGITGDTLGATNQLIETASYLLLAAAVG